MKYTDLAPRFWTDIPLSRRLFSIAVLALIGFGTGCNGPCGYNCHTCYEPCGPALTPYSWEEACAVFPDSSQIMTRATFQRNRIRHNIRPQRLGNRACIDDCVPASCVAPPNCAAPVTCAAPPSCAAPIRRRRPGCAAPPSCALPPGCAAPPSCGVPVSHAGYEGEWEHAYSGGEYLIDEAVHGGYYNEHWGDEEEILVPEPEPVAPHRAGQEDAPAPPSRKPAPVHPQSPRKLEKPQPTEDSTSQGPPLAPPVR